MRARLTDQIEQCRQEIARARIMAHVAESLDIRAEYALLARRWVDVEATLKFASEISEFLEWRATRLEYQG